MTIVISSEVGAIKPEPEIFELALKRLGSMPQESIFIDDNPNYVEAAQKLGMQGITYTDFDSFEQQLQNLLTEQH